MYIKKCQINDTFNSELIGNSRFRLPFGFFGHLPGFPTIWML